MSEKNRNIKQAFLRYIKGYYTKNDADLLIKDLPASIISGNIDEDIDKIWEDSAKVKPSPTKHQEYKSEARILLKQINRPKTTNRIKPFFRYVAAASIIIIAGTTFYLLSKNDKTYLEPALTTIDVAKGSQKQMTLADGTQITLNAGSSLSYPEKFEGEERKIFLDGEAFLKVTPDKGKPFIVQTTDARIKVLGTSFNINAYKENDGLTVSVESGRIQVELSQASVQLSASEQLYYNKESSDFSKSRANVENIKLWISGGMYFDRTPIQDVAQELMRRFNCTIEFSKGEIFEEYIYGTHDGKDLETILKAINLTTGIKYKKENSKIILYKEK